MSMRQTYEDLPPIYHSTVAVESAILVFESVNIKHGESSEICVQPESIFRPIRLMVDPHCAPFYEIVQITIMNMTYLNQPIAATLFPTLPPDYAKLPQDERDLYDSFIKKISFQSCSADALTRLKVRHRKNCPWHLDCVRDVNQDKNTGETISHLCSNVPFSAIFQGIQIVN